MRIREHAITERRRDGLMRCPAHQVRFQAFVYLPPDEYAGSTVQGHHISFALGRGARDRVSNLTFGVTLPCHPSGSVTQSYAGLSGTVDADHPEFDHPEFDISSGDQAFEGGTRSSHVHADRLGTSVSGSVFAQWLGPESTSEDETSSAFCNTHDEGVSFTARLIRRAPAS